jgi:flavin reductase (DIM6/NTAB) family NADH-FMN oxidoreductase RutF
VSVDARAFRDALRLFPAGVTLVTIKSGEIVHGLTVSAFASVSPEPPLVAILIDHQHRAHELLQQPGATFAVSFLGEEQRALSDRFAWTQDEERFAAGDWSVARTGAPVLVDALAWLDCTLHSQHAAGSHTLYIGLVEACSTPRPGAGPLLYWNRDYRRLVVESAVDPATSPITPGSSLP